MGSRFHGFNREKPRKAAFTPQLNWAEDETKFVQFVTAFEDVPEVRYHGFIQVGTKEDGKPLFMDFVSRRDEAIDGADGYDPIWDRGWEPKVRKIAYAVEMEPITEVSGGRKRVMGFTPKQRSFTLKEGGERTVLDIKLIVQSGYIFWDNLEDLDADRPVNEYVWKITRRGARQDTRYSFIDAGKAVELGIPEDNRPDVDAHLMQLAEPERFKVIETLPPNYRLSKYGGPKRVEAEETSPPWNEDEPAQPTAEAEEYDRLKEQLGRKRARS